MAPIEGRVAKTERWWVDCAVFYVPSNTVGLPPQYPLSTKGTVFTDTVIQPRSTCTGRTNGRMVRVLQHFQHVIPAISCLKQF